MKAKFSKPRALFEIARGMLTGKARGARAPRAAAEGGTRPLVLDDVMDFIRVLFSILLPPLGVFLQVGIGPQFWLNILLTLLGYIPGVVHAVWIIAKR